MTATQLDAVRAFISRNRTPTASAIAACLADRATLIAALERIEADGCDDKGSDPDCEAADVARMTLRAVSP